MSDARRHRLLELSEREPWARESLATLKEKASKGDGYTVAFLYALQNPELMDWGFFRKPDSNLGGFFSTLGNMLKDGGVWYEAPLYPVIGL